MCKILRYEFPLKVINLIMAKNRLRDSPWTNLEDLGVNKISITFWIFNLVLHFFRFALASRIRRIRENRPSTSIISAVPNPNIMSNELI